ASVAVRRLRFMAVSFLLSGRAAGTMTSYPDQVYTPAPRAASAGPALSDERLFRNAVPGSRPAPPEPRSHRRPGAGRTRATARRRPATPTPAPPAADASRAVPGAGRPLPARRAVPARRRRQGRLPPPDARRRRYATRRGPTAARLGGCR